MVLKYDFLDDFFLTLLSNFNFFVLIYDRLAFLFMLFEKVKYSVVSKFIFLNGINNFKFDQLLYDLKLILSFSTQVFDDTNLFQMLSI